MHFPTAVIFAALVAAPLLTACQPANDPSTVTSSDPQATTNRGAAVVADYLRLDAAPYRKDRVRFTVKDESGKIDVYEVDTWRRQEDDTTTTLSVIVKPDDDAGTASLAIQQKGQPTTNVTYSRSREDYRETDTGKMFFGGLTIQELLGEWEKYDYHLGGIGVDGRLTVEGKLKPGEHSVIATMTLEFDNGTNLPISMVFLDSGGKEIRRYSHAKTSTVDGHAYISHIEVENPVYKSHTTIDVLTREYPAKLDDSLFTREALKNASKK